MMKKINRFYESEYCYFCHKKGTERHHIYWLRGYRNISENNGFTCSLCPDCHRGRLGVHNNPDIDKLLKKECQQWFEMNHTKEEFIKIIGRNYN